MFFLNSILFLFHVCNICSSLKILMRFLFKVYFSLSKLCFSKLLFSLFGSILFSRGFLGCLLICGCLLIFKSTKWKRWMEALSTQLKFVNCELHCRVTWLRHLVWKILGLSFWARYPEKTLPFFLPERKRFDCECSKSPVEGDGWEPQHPVYNDESYCFHCTSNLNCT